MTFRTHLAAGIASALIITDPSSLTELILCTGVSAIGSVISDVDATTSESRKDLGKVIAVSIAGIAAVIAGDYFLGFDIINRFRSSAAIMRLITGFFIFIGVCVFGEHQPHRSFMHSIAGVAAVTMSFALILPSSVKYMAVSMLSHIIIDTLNKKKIRILYPLRKPRIGLGLCYADGAVNALLFYVFGAAALAVFALKIYRFLPQVF